jgi:hypothetical protein
MLWEYLPATLPPTSEMTSFCQKEFIPGDFRKRDYFGDLKIRGIGRKRYNKEILSAGSSPDWIFSVVKKNPG